uniref:Uncharacterized protein n=1 Tax=Oryza nivara TaxID=4536 RepID=A0A0E0HB98_ORYNI
MASAQRRGEILAQFNELRAHLHQVAGGEAAFQARLREVKKRQPVARAVAIGGEGLQGRVQVHQVTGLVRRRSKPEEVKDYRDEFKFTKLPSLVGPCQVCSQRIHGGGLDYFAKSQSGSELESTGGGVGKDGYHPSHTDC